jgi:hypothetical protein
MFARLLQAPTVIGRISCQRSCYWLVELAFSLKKEITDYTTPTPYSRSRGYHCPVLDSFEEAGTRRMLACAVLQAHRVPLLWLTNRDEASSGILAAEANEALEI